MVAEIRRYAEPGRMADLLDGRLLVSRQFAPDPLRVQLPDRGCSGDRAEMPDQRPSGHVGVAGDGSDGQRLTQMRPDPVQQWREAGPPWPGAGDSMYLGLPPSRCAGTTSCLQYR
jgi:hypothetical protein